MALNDVMWTFSKKIYESTEEFNKDIKEYYNRMREYVDREWKPDEIEPLTSQKFMSIMRHG